MFGVSSARQGAQVARVIYCGGGGATEARAADATVGVDPAGGGDGVRRGASVANTIVIHSAS